VRKVDKGLKAYLNLIKIDLNIDNENMKRVEKEVEYLDNEINKVLKNYPNGKINKFSFIIYMAYILSGVINDDEILEGFIKLLRELYNAKKKP